MLAVCTVAGNVAHSGSGTVPKSTLERCCWRRSGWHQCRCKHQDPEHQNITDTNRCGRDQMLTPRWGAPEDIGLGEIQLQSICLHPHWNLAATDYDPLSKTVSIGRLTVSIDLGVVCILLWHEMMTFDELQQVGSVQEKQDRSNDRTVQDSRPV